MPNLVTSEFLAAVLRAEMDAMLHEIVALAQRGAHPYRSVRRIAELIRKSDFRFVWKEFDGA